MNSLIIDGCKVLIRLKPFNLFRLLEYETLEMFSEQEKRNSKYKFGRIKVCKAEWVRK